MKTCLRGFRPGRTETAVQPQRLELSGLRKYWFYYHSNIKQCCGAFSSAMQFAYDPILKIE